MWRLFAYGGAALWGAGVPLLFYGALRRHRDYVNPPLDASTRERLAAQEWIACYSTFGQARARAREGEGHACGLSCPLSTHRFLSERPVSDGRARRSSPLDDACPRGPAQLAHLENMPDEAMFHSAIERARAMLKEELRLEDEPFAAKLADTGFLWRTWEPHAWHWAALDAAKRAALTAPLAYGADKLGAPVALAVAMAFAFVVVNALDVARPYADEDDDSLAVSAHWALAFAFLIALLVAVGAADNEHGGDVNYSTW